MDRSNTPNSYLVLESTINAELLIYGASQVAQWLRICLQMQEMWVRSLDGEDSLEKEMATYSRIFAWKNSMDREAWRATFHGVAKSWT